MKWEQISLADESEEYKAFVGKFKPKKTTDDCYTPPKVYEAVRSWVCEKYGVDPGKVVRPFWPGGDYRSFDYAGGKVVIDNPTFSILTEIVEFYLEEDVPFFLFAPSLTAFSGRKTAERVNHIFTDTNVIYENGATVRTAFATSFGDAVAETAPDLKKRVDAAVKETQKEGKKELPKYEYPAHVLTAAMMQRYAKYGIEYKVKRGECKLISKLDEQCAHGKAIYGGGLLLSNQKAAERAAAERAAAERAAATKWSLSARERKIVEGLGR